MVCICDILARGGQLGQVKSVVIKISLQGGWPYFGLHTHTQDRLDKSRSASAEARLKSNGRKSVCASSGTIELSTPLPCRNYVADGTNRNQQSIIHTFTGVMPRSHWTTRTSS